MDNKKTPILGFAAYSGTGKTTLLEKLLPILIKKGLRIAVIKHAHHDFDIDYPGKDSYRLRKAGAIETIVASNRRWAHIYEREKTTTEPSLAELFQQLDDSKLDLVLVEGFKHEKFTRIELHRTLIGKNYLYPHDKHIIAIATDNLDQNFTNIRTLDINNTEQIANFILEIILNEKINDDYR